MEYRLCRLCLALNCGRIPLFDEMTMKPNVLLIQKVLECTSIKITAEDDYPSSICAECERKLNELSAFKIQCIVNNDFYREKQAELRKEQQLSCNQQPTEVVCLDDDDDEDEEEEVYYGEEKQTQETREIRVENPTPVLQKKPRIEEIIIEDDDDDEEQNQRLNYESEQTDYGEFNLDDFELVEGQEVDQYYQSETEQIIDNSTILTSILLDDEEDNDGCNNALLMDQGHYEKVYPYECEFCRRRYSSLTKLESHVKTHSQNRMKCFICGKMVVVHLLRHLRSQHPGMAFPEPVRCWHSKCTNLDEVFLDVNQLLAHMDTKRRRR